MFSMLRKFMRLQFILHTPSQIYATPPQIYSCKTQIRYLSFAVSNNVLQLGFLSSRTQNAKTSVAANRTKNAAA